MTTATKANRPAKKGWYQNYKATGKLLAQLEDPRNEYNDDERRFVIVMINLLHRVNMFDRDLGIIIDSVRNLTLRRRLRAIFFVPNSR